MTTATTERLRIEPIRVAHADELFEAFSDPHLYAFQPEPAPRSLASMQREYAEFEQGAPAGLGQVWMNWVVREAATSTCLGKLQATVFEGGDLWVGYKFAASGWGRGLATEAVRWMVGELARRFPDKPMLAAVDQRNAPSIRLLERCGFSLQREEAAELHGQPTVDFIYALAPQATVLG